MKETTNRFNFTPEGWGAVTPRIVVHDSKVSFRRVELS